MTVPLQRSYRVQLHLPEGAEVDGTLRRTLEALLLEGWTVVSVTASARCPGWDVSVVRHRE